MKINKEIRKLSRKMMQASFTDGKLDRAKISAVVQALLEKKPRDFVNILKNYKRLLRTEIEKRRAKIETAAPLAQPVSEQILSKLKQKFGEDLEAEFAVDPALLGGMRVRVGSDVWDGSVRNRLERLQQQL